MSHEVGEGWEVGPAAGERTLRKGFANRYTRICNNKESFLVGVVEAPVDQPAYHRGYPG